ncbi:MAG: ferric reductase-like transmembrane domain-containing protein [Chloroflexi bacterium]|nr:ferric reductase-like transmembrane domain-containing protein [Chloroflexota bacterium]
MRRIQSPTRAYPRLVWSARLWRSRRGRARLLRHYLPLALLSLIGTVVLGARYDVQSPTYRLSIGTAFVSLALFGLCLAIGPIQVLLRGRPAAVSSDLRRDVGVVAALVAFAHVGFGLTVYDDPRLYFLYPLDQWRQRIVPVRLDVFGWANYTGLAATGLLAILLATSADWALRSYGAVRWKGIQQLSYWAFVLTVAHGMLYQRIEDRDQVLVLLFGGIYGLVAALQLGGYVRRTLSQSPRGVRSRW